MKILLLVFLVLEVAMVYDKVRGTKDKGLEAYDKVLDQLNHISEVVNIG